VLSFQFARRRRLALGENGRWMFERPTQRTTWFRQIARGDTWRVCEVVCGAGPADRPFEERHEWVSVAAVLDGVFTYRSHRGRALMTPGSLLLGEAGTCFECGHEHGTGDRCLAFHFAPELMEETLAAHAGRGARRFAAPALPPLERLAPVMARARVLAAIPDQLAAESLALDIARAALALDTGAAARAPSAREEAKAVEALRIIEAGYPEPLTVAGLAQAVGLGRQRFALAFRRATGVTPYGYILRRRLEAAALRLRAGSGTVLEVALEVGFGDLSEFTRRFKLRFGAPPAAWRRAHALIADPPYGPPVAGL
jgi:AraC-like DNA-binding protein